MVLCPSILKTMQKCLILGRYCPVKEYSACSSSPQLLWLCLHNGVLCHICQLDGSDSQGQYNSSKCILRMLRICIFVFSRNWAYWGLRILDVLSCLGQSVTQRTVLLFYLPQDFQRSCCIVINKLLIITYTDGTCFSWI